MIAASRAARAEWTRYAAVAAITAAVVGRVLLVWFSPWSFGYVWDLYHEGIQWAYANGRLPSAGDCWECWQPPLLFVAAAPLYVVGRWLYPMSPWPDDYALLPVSLLLLAAGAASLVYIWRLLRLLHVSGEWRVLAFALAAALPCFFFSSYALEPDGLVAAIVIVFVYYLTRWFRFAGEATVVDVVRLGVLAGLAAEAKYNGVIASIAGVLVVAAGGMRPIAWQRRVRTAAVFVLVTAIVGGWPYVRNLRAHGTPFYANGPAVSGFLFGPRAFARYEVATFRMRDLFALTRPDAPPGMLTDLPVYRSVWTTLHGLTWGDMGFFTNPTRHGTRYPFYQDRHVPPWLASTVLALGVLPTALAVVGFARTARRRRYLPLTIVTVVGWAMYLQYVASQEIWGLKAKYLLFLVPMYVVYAVHGTRTISVRAPWAGTALGAALAVLLVLSNLYLFLFAIG
jgi:hypothetical protein